MAILRLIGTRAARYTTRMKTHTTLDHLAIASTEGAAIERFLEGSLGGQRDRGGEHRGEEDAFEGGQWRFAGNGKLEVLAPLNGPDSRMGRFLKREASRIHHVTFFVDDLALATKRARDLGFDLAAGRPVDGWREAYLSPKQTFGMLFQLVDASSVYEAVGLMPDWAGFARSSAPVKCPSAVEIAALRLNARSRQAAERLLVDCLGGTMEDATSELRFGWPGTTTELRVSVNDAEGPVAIEVSGGAERGLFVSATNRQLDAARDAA